MNRHSIGDALFNALTDDDCNFRGLRGEPMFKLLEDTLRRFGCRINDMPARYWVNQPSSNQPLHRYHGYNVLAVPERIGVMRIYFLAGDTVSMEAPVTSLSEGWR